MEGRCGGDEVYLLNPFAKVRRGPQGSRRAEGETRQPQRLPGELGSDFRAKAREVTPTGHNMKILRPRGYLRPKAMQLRRRSGQAVKIERNGAQIRSLGAF